MMRLQERPEILLGVSALRAAMRREPLLVFWYTLRPRGYAPADGWALGWWRSRRFGVMGGGCNRGFAAGRIVIRL